ncbi:hypothetical protein LWI29_025261 [Acer saccharum]|uniref:Uncharacterized protein n=1 Tax=Acer saccharum TaxID=4024 RepID=A0AA39T5Z2_ACESA|nr:hypothetical protein LWI29_025261 [Acer saccharum]
MPLDVLVTERFALLVEAFKFTLVLGQQATTLPEEANVAKADLEEAMRDVTRAEGSVAFLNKVVTEVE